MLPFGFRLPPALLDTVDALAQRAGVSVNDALLLAVTEWLATNPSAEHVHDAAPALNFAENSPRPRTK